MPSFINEPSRTFNEYLLVPGYSSSNCIPDNVDLKTPLVKYNIKSQEKSPIYLNIPFTSAIMQSVSGSKLAVALAQQGGLSFIYGSQSIESESEMVKSVKRSKAGFVESDSNISINSTLDDLIKLSKKTKHSTVCVTEDGKHNSKFLGIVTRRDYNMGMLSLETPVSEFMTPASETICGNKGITLKEANIMIWKHKLNTLPIVDKNGNLCSLVFRKDFESHMKNRHELLDNNKRFMVGAGINTRDFKERVPALIEAGADVLCIDSSEGFSEWQKITIDWIRKNYGESVKVGAGNVIDKDGFNFLAECGADFIKVGIGGGSICITREAKGIGRGQASALIDVCAARDEYCKKTGVYIPVCSDGGIVYDHHITLSLAMGADFVMLGRYFARFDESPSNLVSIDGKYYKEYWGEGSSRARNWQRYDQGGSESLTFEEGVDSYVPYAGSLKDNVMRSILKIKSTMCNCGAINLLEFKDKAKLTLVSATSIVEGGAHDVVKKNSSVYIK